MCAFLPEVLVPCVKVAVEVDQRHRPEFVADSLQKEGQQKIKNPNEEVGQQSILRRIARVYYIVLLVTRVVLDVDVDVERRERGFADEARCRQNLRGLEHARQTRKHSDISRTRPQTCAFSRVGLTSLAASGTDTPRNKHCTLALGDEQKQKLQINGN